MNAIQVLRAVAGALSLLFFTHANAGAQTWYLAGVEYNRGPLDCDVQGGLFLDWQQRQGREDGAVKFQTRDASFMAVMAWTQPQYRPEVDSIVAELAGSILRGDRHTPRLIVQRQWIRDGVPFGRFTSFATAMAGASSATTSWQGTLETAVLGLQVRRLTGVAVRVNFSDGRRCNSWLADYHFRRN